ncbi:hypothetical protein [Delftia acidovorans]|uniref:hypothetical protein n=2 Tax=Delftia acidovorans TaxID=80866 RepID=UPI001E640909|nr:hypothetical protein [Delftia acidovorans]
MDSVLPIRVDCLNALRLSMIRFLERGKEAAPELPPRVVCTMTCRVAIHRPLGDEVDFRELRGRKKISRPFSLDWEMLSESIFAKALLDKAPP